MMWKQKKTLHQKKPTVLVQDTQLSDDDDEELQSLLKSSTKHQQGKDEEESQTSFEKGAPPQKVNEFMNY